MRLTAFPRGVNTSNRLGETSVAFPLRRPFAASCTSRRGRRTAGAACTNGRGPHRQHLTMVTPRGDVSRFARNALDDTELAGVCFGPGERVLFVNIYGRSSTPGMTLAIRGAVVGTSPASHT